MGFIQTVSSVSCDCKCEKILTDCLGVGFVFDFGQLRYYLP